MHQIFYHLVSFPIRDVYHTLFGRLCVPSSVARASDTVDINIQRVDISSDTISNIGSGRRGVLWTLSTKHLDI